MSLYSPWVLLSGPLRCHIFGIRRSFVSHREHCIFYKLLFSVPGGVHAILKHSVVMAPWNGSPALRLMTVPHFSRFFWCANKRCLFVKLSMLRCCAWCETNTSIDVAAKICKNLKGIESILNILNHFTI